MNIEELLKSSLEALQKNLESGSMPPVTSDVLAGITLLKIWDELRLLRELLEK
jgi:hypothetical protein